MLKKRNVETDTLKKSKTLATTKMFSDVREIFAQGRNFYQLCFAHVRRVIQECLMIVGKNRETRSPSKRASAFSLCAFIAR